MILLNTQGKAVVRITIDETGKAVQINVITESEKLKLVLSKAFQNFPDMQLSIVNNKVSTMTYKIPLEF